LELLYDDLDTLNGDKNEWSCLEPYIW